MQMTKTLLWLLLALLVCAAPALGARRLRKKPKVYNALITTDENLTSSRAYPVIQPTIHEPGYAPFGPYNPYAFFSPPLVRFGQPLVPGLPSAERLPYPLPPAYAPYAPNEPERLPGPEQVPQSEPASSDAERKEQLPLALNEQGLPPVLIRLPTQYNGNGVQLPPYDYSQYPVIYDQAGYPRQRESYLPPYDYYPSQGYPTKAPPAQTPPQPQSQPLPHLPLDNFASTPSFEDIRNGAESKNSDVPDVPPPPIPSGPKRSQPEDI